MFTCYYCKNEIQCVSIVVEEKYLAHTNCADKKILKDKWLNSKLLENLTYNDNVGYLFKCNEKQII